MSDLTPEEIEQLIKDLMYNVVGMDYNTNKVLELKKKLQIMKEDNKNENK